jgi:hypothetical protein
LQVFIIDASIASPPRQSIYVKLKEIMAKKLEVGIGNIADRGTVPPRWKLGGKKNTLLRLRGVVLEPTSKELIVSDMRQNALLTYCFPVVVLNRRLRLRYSGRFLFPLKLHCLAPRKF